MQAKAIKYWFNDGKWKKIREIKISDLQLFETLSANTKKLTGFYHYELFASDGKKKGDIYTIHNCLFD